MLSFVLRACPNNNTLNIIIIDIIIIIMIVHSVCLFALMHFFFILHVLDEQDCHRNIYSEFEINYCYYLTGESSAFNSSA